MDYLVLDQIEMALIRIESGCQFRLLVETLGADYHKVRVARILD